MTTTHLLIARHGNTFAKGEVVTRLGKTDKPLVASGEAQAERIVSFLTAEGLLPDVAFTSTLQRTRRMAEIIRDATALPFPTYALEQFDEIDYGEDENRPESDVIARLGAEAIRLWDEEAIPPQGWQVDVPTLIAAWQDFAGQLLREHHGKTTLVVTSNGIARFAPYLTGDYSAFRATHSLKLRTGGLCLLTHDRSATHWQCEWWNRAV
jgi:2,3-bisphosphoglycerate-dependent phosphoglycerate mutase